MCHYPRRQGVGPPWTGHFRRPVRSFSAPAHCSRSRSPALLTYSLAARSSTHLSGPNRPHLYSSSSSESIGLTQACIFGTSGAGRPPALCQSAWLGTMSHTTPSRTEPLASISSRRPHAIRAMCSVPPLANTTSSQPPTATTCITADRALHTQSSSHQWTRMAMPQSRRPSVVRQWTLLGPV